MGGKLYFFCCTDPDTGAFNELRLSASCVLAESLTICVRVSIVVWVSESGCLVATKSCRKSFTKTECAANEDSPSTTVAFVDSDKIDRLRPGDTEGRAARGRDASLPASLALPAIGTCVLRSWSNFVMPSSRCSMASIFLSLAESTGVRPKNDSGMIQGRWTYYWGVSNMRVRFSLR